MPARLPIVVFSGIRLMAMMYLIFIEVLGYVEMQGGSVLAADGK